MTYLKYLEFFQMRELKTAKKTNFGGEGRKTLIHWILIYPERLISRSRRAENTFDGISRQNCLLSCSTPYKVRPVAVKQLSGKALLSFLKLKEKKKAPGCPCDWIYIR